MSSKKRFKKSKVVINAPAEKEKLFAITYQSSISKFNPKVFPVAKVILPTIALFLASLLLLALGSDGLSKIDQVLAVNNDQPVKAEITSQIAGVAKTPEIKIVSKNLPTPTFGSNAVLAQDLDSGTILYQKNIYTKLAPASTTKLMTALVAVDHYQAADILTVPAQALVGGSVMELRAGDRLSFRSLLYGMLLDSGNDAAYTLALDYPGGLGSFVAQMNKKAQDLELTSTHFMNPAGFDDPNHYSSAYDLSKIAKQVAQNYELARIVATKDTQVTTWNETETLAVNHQFVLHNLNQLLDQPGVIGMKTGTTEAAGENLVGEVDRSGHKLITVVLGSKNRFNETKSLIDWVYANYNWQ